jgi:hypothetical protein
VLLPAFWIYSGFLIVLVVAFLIFVVIGMMRLKRGGNKGTQTDDGLAHTAPSNDLTRKTHEQESEESLTHTTPV